MTEGIALGVPGGSDISAGYKLVWRLSRRKRRPVELDELEALIRLD